MICAPSITPPDPNPKTPKSRIPAGACDCHFHVFDGPSPQIAQRSYTATPAPLSAYKAVQSALGTDRAIIVQPSIYGTNNQTTLQSLPKDGSMKAIVVVDDTADIEELKSLADQGAVGVRVNMLFSSDARLENLSNLARKMAELDWHLQVLADVSELPNLREFVSRLPVPVVFDHMGHLPSQKGINDPGFKSLLKLLEEGQVWVKLSGAYRLAPSNSVDYREVAPIAKALVEANSDRLVWGSDWPHPSFDGHMPNDGDLLDHLFDWANAQTAKKILVDNPQRLYGFEKPGASDG